MQRKRIIINIILPKLLSQAVAMQGPEFKQTGYQLIDKIAEFPDNIGLKPVTVNLSFRSAFVINPAQSDQSSVSLLHWNQPAGFASRVKSPKNLSENCIGGVTKK
jgi:hypothetical protein